MGTHMDWNDYLEPEFDGPQVNIMFRCPKCGHQEVVPDDANQIKSSGFTITCPKCKLRMYEDTER